MTPLLNVKPKKKKNVDKYELCSSARQHPAETGVGFPPCNNHQTLRTPLKVYCVKLEKTVGKKPQKTLTTSGQI